MRVTVIGLGSMGRALAARLLGTGHEVTVWNRTSGRAPEVLAAGGRGAPTAHEAVQGAASVHLCLADGTAVEAVVLGDGEAAGIAGELAGAVLVDHSTVSPTTSRRLAEAVPGRHMVAAPILGAPQAVASGEALYLLAGPANDVESLEEVWRALSGEAHRFVGEDPGTATTMKLLANYLLMSGLATLAEAVATGRAAGIDDATLAEFFGVLPLVAPGLKNRLDALIGGDHNGWFTTTLGAKDVRLTVELARTNGVELPLGELVERRYQAAADAGLAEADITAVIELLR